MRLGFLSKSLVLVMGLLALVPVFAVAEGGLGFSEFYFATLKRQYGDAAERRVRNWENLVDQLQGVPEKQQLNRVNRFFNQVRFLDDQMHWRRGDYWATPIELLATNGGDCEDFAIAKYISLKKLGVPESRMRLAIVMDEWKNIPHAILIVYTDGGPMILDNQVKQASWAHDVDRYRPIYSINQQNWWRHVS